VPKYYVDQTEKTGRSACYNKKDLPVNMRTIYVSIGTFTRRYAAF